MDKNETLKINRDQKLIYPLLNVKVERALKAAAEKGYPLAIFEGYRSPQRQTQLYSQGRTAPGQIVTWTKAWESYHQYGLAVDVVGFDGHVWNWDIDYPSIASFFTAEGLIWLGPKDKPHFQMDLGLPILIVRQMCIEYGLQRLWQEAEFHLSKR